jgi:hypothetical protein
MAKGFEKIRDTNWLRILTPLEKVIYGVGKLGIWRRRS